MRCRLCQKQAVYRELRFCPDHFIQFFEKKVRYYLDRAHIKDTKILVGVSGGKDSAATAAILAELKEEYNLDIHLFVIHLRIPGYSDAGVAAAKELAKNLAVPIIVWDLNDFSKQIPDFAKGKFTKPCSQCGVIKRYLLNKAAQDLGFEYVATGHNLDDEHYFAMHSLENGDIVQLLRNDKQLPPKPEKKLAGRIKPLYYLTEKESMIYCLLKNLPVDHQECPFSVGNPQIKFKEEHSNRQKKSNFLKTMRKIKRMIPADDAEKKEQELLSCSSCGYPTTRTDACVFCRLMQEKPKK